jgi:hypothetical protein
MAVTYYVCFDLYYIGKLLIVGYFKSNIALYLFHRNKISLSECPWDLL